MENTQNVVPFAIPSNKFYPPHIDHSLSLLREDLLENKLPKQISAKKVVIVEAQAGQGKTTLIAQFLNHNSFDHLWYQVGQEDSDPIVLLSSLLANFTVNFPDFSSPQLVHILEEGQVGPLDLPRCANILLNDIDAYLQEDIYIVFDDIHLVSEAALTQTLFTLLLDASPPRLHFIFTTRHPLELKCKTLRDANQITYLCTQDLALSEREIEDLYNTVFKQDITRKDAMDIWRITNGWVMGIVLAGHPISGRDKFWQQPDLDLKQPAANPHGHMLDYFQDEIFDKIPAELHSEFLKLSLLTEIPINLAALITGRDDFEKTLTQMAHDNFFVYHLDDQSSVFRFHHFFQEFLQLRARQELTEKELLNVHIVEAEYYLEKEMLEKALAAYNKARAYHTMEIILKSRGVELIAKNRTLSILAILESIPQETLHEYSWLTLYVGLLRNDFIPQTTLPYYEKARENFIQDGDETGELIALSQMIYFHFVISGLYKVGAELLPRTRELLEKNRDELPDAVQIIAARNLASGYCFFTGDLEKARTFISIATTLSARQKSQNFIAASNFIQGYIELFSGNRAKFLREAEICYNLLNDPRVGMSNKLTIRIMYLCYLSMTGDFLNYRIQQQAIQDEIDPRVVKQTVAAPYLYIWAAIGYISKGDINGALDLLNTCSSMTATASTGHMRSQLLQWVAMAHALQGETDESLEFIEESRTRRDEAGGPFYLAFHHMLAGNVYGHAGDKRRAREELDQGIKLAETIPSTFLSICGLMFRSYLFLLTEGEESCLADLEAALSLMKINGYTHFWGWEPVMMEKLLSVAVRYDIEKDFANSLSRLHLKQSIKDDGQHVPLLEFTILDRFQISFKGSVISHTKDLTQAQRELLGLVLTSKGQRISQERVQLERWPDTTPENARKSFDTLLTRFRKELAKHPDMQVKEHIFMQKGILCLAHYDLDVLKFSEAAKTGIAHSRNGDWWQAGNSFNIALHFWKGILPEETFKSEQVLDYNDHLVAVLVEFILVWAKHLAVSGNPEAAVKVINRGLEVDSLEERLITLLYTLHLYNNAPLKARKTLDSYRTALLKIDYPNEECEDYIRGMVKTAKERLNELELAREI